MVGGRERERERERVLICLTSRSSIENLRIENDLRLSTFKCNFDAFHFTKESN